MIKKQIKIKSLIIDSGKNTSTFRIIDVDDNHITVFKTALIEKTDIGEIAKFVNENMNPVANVERNEEEYMRIISCNITTSEI